MQVRIDASPPHETRCNGLGTLPLIGRIRVRADWLVDRFNEGKQSAGAVMTRVDLSNGV